MHTTLALAVVGLAIGPIVYRLLDRVRWAYAAIDGFVLTAISALVLLHITPRAFSIGGGFAVIGLVAGLAAPSLFSKLLGGQSRAERWAVYLGAIGMAAHGAVDGAVLVGGQEAISWAVILHRVPAGLFIWWLIRPSHGRLKAAIALAAVALCTVIGFFAAQQIGFSQAYGLAIFEAFVAGALLHVLTGHGSEFHGKHKGAHSRPAELAGAVCGLLVVVLLPEAHHEDSHEFAEYAERFLGLTLEAAPALLLGFACAGIFAAWLPRGSVQWVSKGNHLSQTLRGITFGMPLPICSCGVLPVYEGLIRKRTAAPAAMAFLVATPELGIESVFLSFSLLGWELTGARLLGAALVALLAGLLVGGRVAKSQSGPQELDDADEVAPSFQERVRTMMHFGFKEVVDNTMGWILLGIGIAALFHSDALSPLLENLPAGAAVLFFALVSIPAYVCASGATPLAAALILAGVSPGSAVAFLLAGPATNVTTFGILSRLHGLRVAGLFGAVVFGLSVAVGMLVDLLLGAPGAVQVVEAASHAHAHDYPAWKLAAGLAFGALFLASLIRQGPRGFVRSIGSPHHHGHAGHDHTH